jgi:hypothetical protein
MANHTLARLSFLTVALASPLSFAAGDGFRALNNEAGSEFIGTVGTFTRDDVRRNLLSSRGADTWRVTEASASPSEGAVRAGFVQSREEARQTSALRDRAVPATGWRDLGGEAGWVFEGR